MVATISVLKGGANGAAKYFTSTRGYYDLESSGVWSGVASERLGLFGKVRPVDFGLLLAGYAPSGGRLARRTPLREEDAGDAKVENTPSSHEAADSNRDEVRKKDRASHVPGYDLCFSAPKSVSLLWAVGSPQVRIDVEVCIREAVRQTLKDVETLLPLGRRGRNGTEQIRAELVSAMFLHTTSRDLDPQLHIHNVIPNRCFGEDGRWGGVNSRTLHNWTPALGRVFRCHLADSLVQRLGIELYRPERSDGSPEAWFEIKGVASQVIKSFSQRRRTIEKTTPAEAMTDSHERAKVCRNTRKKKNVNNDLVRLTKRWKRRAAEHGLTEATVDKICGHSVARQPLSKEEIQETTEWAVQQVGRENAHFRECDVVSAFCERIQERGVNPSALIPQVLEHLQQSNNVVVLDGKPAQRQYSTRDNWQREKQLDRDVDDLADTRGARVSISTVRKTCDRFLNDRKKPFSAEQSQAVRNLLTDEKSIRILTGVAGAGKSVTLDAVRYALERQGYQVIGGALAGTAAAGLREKTNMPTRTVASYLYHLEKRLPRRVADRVRFDARMMIRALRGKPTYKFARVKIPRKSVLIIDEAGMLDTRTMSRLVYHVKKAKATLILVGDTEQLPPIEAGGPFDRIARKLGYARLETSHRQLNPADAKAAAAVRRGAVKEALDNYNQRGRLTVSENQQETINRIVEAWKENGGTKKPAEQIILTQTRADADELNRRCQKERLASKRIPGLGIRHGETTYYSGDRVMFHLPMRTLGIENGFTGTVMKVDLVRRRMSVRLDNNAARKSGKKHSQTRFVTIPLFHVDHAAVSLGYAATTHKLQGATVDHALVLLGGRMLSKQLAYTQLTRARKTTKLFVSQDQVGDNFELLVKAMSRSAKKNLAHDIKQDAAATKSARVQPPTTPLHDY